MGIETNKIAGAVLSTLLIVVSLNMVAGIIFASQKPIISGYELPSEDLAITAKGAPAVTADEPIEIRLAKADPTRGERAVGTCRACHTFEKGGADKIGP